MSRSFRIPGSVVVTVALALSGCQGPGPLPAEYAARVLPEVAADPARDMEVARVTADARAAFRLGEFAQAMAHAEAAVALHPRAAAARALLGAALAQVGGRGDVSLADLERGEGELLLARRLAPNDAEIHLLFARFLERDGHLTRSVAELGQLLAAHPKNRPGLEMAGRLHFELGQERAAGPLLRQLLALDPKNAAAAYRLAHCELRLAEAVARKDTPTQLPKGAGMRAYRQAAAAFRTYQSLAPEDSAGLLGEAHARFQAALETPDPDPAELRGILSRLDAATVLDPRGAAAHHSRGVVLERLGEPRAAESAYREALQRDPKFVASLFNLGRLLDASGDRAGASVLLRQVAALPISAAERKELASYLAK